MKARNIDETRTALNRATERRREAILTLDYLRDALASAKRSRCAPELLRRIRAAIKSAEGASRNARLKAERAHSEFGDATLADRAAQTEEGTKEGAAE